MKLSPTKPFEKQVEEKYHVSWLIIAYKLSFGLSELFLGIYITLFGRVALLWYQAQTIQELTEDPHDLLVRLTEGVIPNVLAHHTFLAIYLIILGTAKAAGAVGLIFKQNWGVDLLVGLTLIMLPFQVIRLTLHPSIIESLYVVIGLIIAMYLINFRPHEWIKRTASKLGSNK
jgi:uncharacterized membrane protein